MSKTLLTSTLFLSFMVLNPAIGWACRCKNPATTSAAYSKADIVVYGHVDSLTGDINTQSGSVAAITVSDAWKGEVPRQIKLNNQTTCAYDFKVGQYYLVFLNKTATKGELETTICSGNLSVGDVGSAKQWLNSKGMKAQIGISN